MVSKRKDGWLVLPIFSYLNVIIYYNVVVYFTFREMYNVGKDVNTKDELILKVDYSSLESIDKFIDFLKSNTVEVKAIGRDENVVKL